MSLNYIFLKPSLKSQSLIIYIKGKYVYPTPPRSHTDALTCTFTNRQPDRLSFNPHRECNHHLLKHVVHLLWVKDNLPIMRFF